MLGSFGFFGHRSWIQLLALTDGFHASVTIAHLALADFKIKVKQIANIPPACIIV